MPEFKRTLITAALPYANGPLHIGHIAGCYLPADMYARYLRLKGSDCLFVCGSDEHGVPITIRAQKEGITPGQVVDKYHSIMKKAFHDAGIRFDIYSRTSSPEHHATSREIFLDLYNQHVFTEEVTEQYYDPKEHKFLADRYITGTCPRCGNENAYGDQCEKCGSTLSPTELKNPRSALSGEKPILKETRNWFLPLDRMQPRLDAYINDHKSDWKPNVYGQCKSWLNEGLKPRAMTRDLDWGVPVPLEGAEGKVLYVWFDAPIGYISFTRQHSPNDWKKWWKEKDTRIVHFIGKDNIVFHCLIFPAMLMHAGGYQWADNVPANEFLNLEGEKLSTSRNHAVWLHEYLEDFPGKTDELRYVLTSIAPETKDSDFTWKDFQARINSELVAILGNFVNRVMVLTHKFYGGKIPDAGFGDSDAAESTKENTELCRKAIQTSIELCKKYLDTFKFRDALAEMMNIARIGNKYLADTEPWKKIKSDEAATAGIMNFGIQITALLSQVCEPFLPVTAENIRRQINLPKNKISGCWNTNEFSEIISAGHTINEATLLFKNIENVEIENQLEKLRQRTESNKPVINGKPLKPMITYEDFTKMDIRVGEILEAEKVEGADKLLKLKVDTGIDQRTVVSGIAPYFKPEEIVGQKVSVLMNLAPRKIRGVESHGMILMAEDKDGKLTFVQPKDCAVGNGSEIR